MTSDTCTCVWILNQPAPEPCAYCAPFVAKSIAEHEAMEAARVTAMPKLTVAERVARAQARMAKRDRK